MNTLLRNSKLLSTVFILFCLFFVGNAFGQTNTWDGSSSFNWNTAANWSLNLVPTSAHDVVIPNNFDVTINTAAVCKTFTINDGNRSNTVTISTGNSLTVSGAVTIGAGTGSADDKLLNVGSNIFSCASISVTAPGSNNRISGITLSTGTITVTGNITLGSTDADFTFTGSGILNVGGTMSGGSFTSSTGTVNYNGSGAQNIGAYTYNNLTTSGGNTKTLVAATTVSGSLNIVSGTTLNASTFAITGAALTTTGTGILRTQNTSGTPLPTGRTWSGTVQYDGASQTVVTGTYNTLNFAGSGTKTLSGALTIVGNLSIASGVVSNLGTFRHTSATLTLGATVQTTGTSYGGTGSPAANINSTYFANNTGYLNVGTCSSTYSLTSIAAATPICIGNTATINVTSTAANLPNGTYTVFYTLGAPNVGTGIATMTVSGGTGSGSFTTTTLANSGATSITINSVRFGTACVYVISSGNTGTITFNPNLPASVSIAAAPSSIICPGTNVTFTATPTNGGTPSYQWKLNGADVGTNSATYSNNALANNDLVTVVMTSTASPCLTGSPATSNTVTMTVNPIPTAVTAVASAATICSGGSVNLTSSATSNSATATTLLNQNFNGIPAGWTTTNTSTGGTPANAAWTLRANGYNDGNETFNSNDASQFYLSNSDAQGNGGTTATTLQSPAFSTIGMSAASLNFFQYYRYNGTETAVVQVSTDGSNWVNLNTAPTATIGTRTAFASTTLSLSAYLNQPTVSIRFKYDGNFDWYWAIDNVTVTSTPATPAISYAWTSTPSGYTSSIQNPTGVSPTVATTYTVTATNNYGCTASATTASVAVSNTNTWTGSTSIAWTTASNWSCNLVPTAVTDVIIGTSSNYPEISSDVAINTLTLNSGTTLKVNSTFDLTVTDLITNNGTLTIENSGNLLQVNNVTNTGSGSTIVKRNSNPLIRLDYTLWSSPVSGQNLFNFSPLTSVSPNIRFYTYNPTINAPATTGFYQSVAAYATTDFAIGKGYLIRLPFNHPTAATIWNGQFTGVPFNGTPSPSVAISSTGDRFNAVGNPYPSPISISQFATDNSANIETTLYFWRKTNNAANASYCSWNTATSTYSDNGEAYTESPLGVIQTGQGFLVQAKTGASSLVFNNGQRIGDNANQFFRTSVGASINTTSIEANRIWLNMTGATSGFSQSVVGYFTNGTLGLDDTDSRYFNDGPIALTSTIANEDYVIQGRPVPFDATDVVAMKYKVTTAGQYTISIDHVDGLFATGQEIFLRDNLTTTVHNLTAGGYTFTSEAGTFASRFEIIYQGALGVTNPTFNANQVIVYKNEANDFVINSGTVMMASVKVFDIRGRLLLERKGINATETNLTVGMSNEVLLVQITSEDGEVVTKKVLR
ncbi:beta strand repeat-containing protein [Flavobacterium sp. RSB2_4_14]|uniref:beta strand repeat-containing protein n=1 Tax=Flavobacterium sp. RSB2_4_14 TaxID=3447665 RepID=UPI003F2B11E2